MGRDCQIKVTISRCLFIGIMKVGSCCHGDIHIHTKVMGALTLEGVSLIRIQFMRGTKISSVQDPSMSISEALSRVGLWFLSPTPHSPTHLSNSNTDFIAFAVTAARAVFLV